jgi:hypothetical protein
MAKKQNKSVVSRRRLKLNWTRIHWNGGRWRNEERKQQQQRRKKTNENWKEKMRQRLQTRQVNERRADEY